MNVLLAEMNTRNREKSYDKGEGVMFQSGYRIDFGKQQRRHMPYNI